MSYTRRRSRRNTRRTQRPRYTGSKSEIIRRPVPRISTINQKIKKIQSAIELKYVDNLYSSQVDNTPDLYLLNVMPAGTNPNNRIGNKVNATSIQFRGTLISNSLALDPTQVRIIVFWDQQANGAAPPIEGSTTAGTEGLLDVTVVTQPIMAPYSMEAQKRFSILYDKTYTINPQVGVPGDEENSVVPVSLYIKKKIQLSRVVKYDNAAGGTIADIQTNSLYMVAISDRATEVPTFTFGSRFIFKDA